MKTIVIALALGTFTMATKTASATDLSGCWSGYWQSCTTGHKGPLEANFCKLDESRYRVTFTGRFFKIIPFKYQVTLNVVSDDGESVTLSGKSYLGRRYGTFTYRATASQTRFVANYTSCKDDGKFVLCRTCTSCSN